MCSMGWNQMNLYWISLVFQFLVGISRGKKFSESVWYQFQVDVEPCRLRVQVTGGRKEGRK